MSFRNIRWIALAVVFAVTQLACYNTYTIDKDELSKLEATVDRYEVVEVAADCPDDDIADSGEIVEGEKYASAEPQQEGEVDAEEAMTDAMVRTMSDDEVGQCTRVPVSTVNALTLLTTDGSEQRVTPFNFVMDDVQLVSPEYDVLVQLDRVEGAEVREFSAWKTAGTIAGVTAVTVGTFVGVSLLAPEEEGF